METLKHKLIVLTGGISSGKTTIKLELLNFLQQLNIPFKEISGIRDLYIPFAQNEEILPKKDEYTREETTQLMRDLYATYGEELGTHLLVDYLKNKSLETWYVLDSKRNPNGIVEIKKTFENPIVLGVSASTYDRKNRILSRERDFDKSSLQIKTPLTMFKEEENTFRISDALQEATDLIWNDRELPNEKICKLTEILMKHEYLNSTKHREVMPLRGKESSINNVLQQKEIPGLLSKFRKSVSANEVIVIQGGNRYISHQLQQYYTTKAMKLLCMSKVPLAVGLNTILEINDRIKILSNSQSKTLIHQVREIDSNTLASLEKKCNELSVYSTIEETIKNENVELLLKLFAGDTINTPFTYPFDDSLLKEQFVDMISMLKKEDSLIPHLPCIKTILSETNLYKNLHSNDRIVMIDDVFYRGRTYYAAINLLTCFDISVDKVDFYTLCDDRESRSIDTEKITVLKSGVLYPFENSICTEGGYWQEKQGYFEFTNLEAYWQYLDMTADKNPYIYQKWNSLLHEQTDDLSKDISDTMEEALSWLVVYSKTYDITIEETIVDQRADNIGVCVPFGLMIHNFINQEEPANKRWDFKGKISKSLDSLFKKDWKDAIEFYKEHHKTIDYHGLDWLFSQGKNDNQTRM